jgi:acetyl-CoA C-acetyltransferase
MAPTKAVANLLERNNLTFNDFDFIEIHEAFAGQVLCTLKAWESEEFCKNTLGLKGALGKIDPNRLNVKGSSLALGHPFAATGSRIVTQLAKMLKGTKGKRGLISVCTAGGMGVAAILESVE